MENGKNKGISKSNLMNFEELHTVNYHQNELIRDLVLNSVPQPRKKNNKMIKLINKLDNHHKQFFNKSLHNNNNSGNHISNEFNHLK